MVKHDDTCYDHTYFFRIQFHIFNDDMCMYNNNTITNSKLLY